ncbi:Lactate dehydrogenase-related dehydrogenase [Thermoplasmatales archaeon BRNA1]|nr:Lactate dehydrogenase-related dehydrogenase [Thermoplasmatales archaeon BRNA1]
MKVFVYNYREFDEAKYFRKFAEDFGFELGYTEQDPTMDTCHLADGSDFISVITTPITPEMMDRFKAGGVKMISTRTIGYNHIDLEYAKKIGMAVSHITYDPEGVAEYTVMMMLMVVRKIVPILERCARNDFTLKGVLAGKLKNMSVGIIGAGKIGVTVLRDLSGFGCRLYYCNRSMNAEAEKYAERLSMDEILGACDIISLHLELNQETFHMIDEKAISKMKRGSVLVNTARGPLVDTGALIKALDSGQLGAAALDVIEDEFGLYYNDCTKMEIKNRALNELRGRDNVLLTHHMAFYYENAVRDMVYNCLYGMKMLAEGKDIPYRLA